MTIVTSLRIGMPPKSEMKAGTESESQLATESEFESEFEKPLNFLASGEGLDTELLATELEEMELDPSSELQAFTRSKEVKLNAEEEHHRRSRPMMWVHIHKAGGSFICAAAHLNDESIGKGGNCNSKKLNDGGNGAWYTGGANCSQREKEFAQNKLTWGQIERVLPLNPSRELCFDNFDYAIWLRDPIKLALSEANFKKYDPKDVRKAIACVQNGGGCPKWEEKKDDVPLWKFMDNYAVRVLGGPAVYTKKVGQVTEEDAKRAMKLLERFKIKVNMDDVVSNPNLKKSFLQRMGWSQWPGVSDGKKTGNSQGTRMSTGQPVKNRFSDSQKTIIREAAKYDYMLYDYVKTQM